MNKSLPQEAIEDLRTKDPILTKVIDLVGVLDDRKSTNYFLSLVESIVSQQLSVKVADVIYARLVTLYTKGNITPEETLTIDTEDMRKVGMSYSKIKYIKSLAQHVVDSPKMFEKFDQMSEEEIIIELTKVKGVGRWTAEMFLLFTMGKPDIFSYGDLGLRNALKNLYHLTEITPEIAEKITTVWKPYRSYGSRYLWKSLEKDIQQMINNEKK